MMMKKKREDTNKMMMMMMMMMMVMIQSKSPVIHCFAVGLGLWFGIHTCYLMKAMEALYHFTGTGDTRILLNF